MKSEDKKIFEASSNISNYRSANGLTMTWDDAFRDGVEWRDKNPIETPWNKVVDRLPMGNRNDRVVMCVVLFSFGRYEIMGFDVISNKWVNKSGYDDSAIEKWMYIPNIKGYDEH